MTELIHLSLQRNKSCSSENYSLTRVDRDRPCVVVHLERSSSYCIYRRDYGRLQNY